MKSHLTYPRTGYVQPPDEAPPPPILTSLSLTPAPPADDNVTHFMRRTVMAVWFLLYCSFSKDPPRPIAPLADGRAGGSPLCVEPGVGAPLPLVVDTDFGAHGAGVRVVGRAQLLQPMLAMVLAGAWLAAQGVCALVNYLRANPNPQAPEGVRA